MCDKPIRFVISQIGEVDSDFRHRANEILRFIIRPSVPDTYTTLRSGQIAKPRMTQEIIDLLAHAVWPPTVERAGEVLQKIYGVADTTLYLATEGDITLGLVGIRRLGPISAEIVHIAVKPERRLRGVGRSMVWDLLAVESLQELLAETDHDAIGFYRALGFEVHSLGEKYPGAERFRCALGVSTG